MVSKKKIATTAATFGAAMTAMYAAPELQAQIVDVTWEGGAASATNPFFLGSGTPQPFKMDQVTGASAADFNQWNDTYGGTGRTVNVGPGAGSSVNIMSATAVALGQSIDPNTFAPVETDGVFGGTTFDGSGSAFIGFRTFGGNVGWFRLDYTIGGAIIYSDGEFATNGETVVVGGTTGGPGGFVAPTAFTPFRGIQLSGTLADFAESDDASATYNPGFTLNNLEAPVWLIFDGNAPSATSFRVESNAGTPGLTYTVEAWNFNTSAFDIIGTQSEAFNSDAIVDFDLVAADHIDTDGSVQTRVGWRQTGFVINFPWEVRVDQAGWNQ